MKTPASLSAPSRRASALRRYSGFTLVEVMIGSTIGSMILVGVMSSFLMIGRSSQRLYYYNIMEAESRRTLEEFAQDVRMGSDSFYNSSTSVTLTVPDNYTTASTPNKVTYAFGTATDATGTTYTNCFYRKPGIATSTDTPTIFIKNVTSCSFTLYTVLGGDPIDPVASATHDADTRRIELKLTVSNTRSTLVAATDNIVSATYLLRNK